MMPLTIIMKSSFWRSMVVFATVASVNSAYAAPTICQAQTANTYCTDSSPGPVGSNGYNNMPYWANINKIFVSIAVRDDRVWGVDASGSLWYLQNWRANTNWTLIGAGYKQVSASHDAVCAIGANSHLYCAEAMVNASAPNVLRDIGLVNFSTIAMSAGTQLWAIDNTPNSNLYRVTDFNQLAQTTTMVAQGVKEVAVDGNGLVCQVNGGNAHVYCVGWSLPPGGTGVSYYHSLPWFDTGKSLKNISVQNGQVTGIDSDGNVILIQDYANSAKAVRIAYAGVGARMAGSSEPSKFVPNHFKSDEVAVMMFMGQSNSAGSNSIPAKFTSEVPYPNVRGIKNAGWNYITGNQNGVTPSFANSISSIGMVNWTNWSMSGALKKDGNLGFATNIGPVATGANFAAYQWQGMINAGWKLPNLHIIHVGWGSQGVDPLDNVGYINGAPWTANGTALWVPSLGAANQPKNALAPFARQMIYRGMENILASGKVPRVVGLQWNQWEAEVVTGNSAVIRNAPANYQSLVDGFYRAANYQKFPVQFVQPNAVGWASAANLTAMRNVFSGLVGQDPVLRSVVDPLSQISPLFNGGVYGGGDGSVHYSIDVQQWFGHAAINPCLKNASCGTRIPQLGAAPN